MNLHCDLERFTSIPPRPSPPMCSYGIRLAGVRSILQPLKNIQMYEVDESDRQRTPTLAIRRGRDNQDGLRRSPDEDGSVVYQTRGAGAKMGEDVGYILWMRRWMSRGVWM